MTTREIVESARLLHWLQLDKPITAEIAFNEFGITRLSRALDALRDQGHVIHAKPITSRDRHGAKFETAEYWLVRSVPLSSTAAV